MANEEFDFDTWFDALTAVVLDKCGVEFNDRDSVLADYNDGRNYVDVADEIADEYADCD